MIQAAGSAVFPSALKNSFGNGEHEMFSGLFSYIWKAFDFSDSR